MIEFLSKDDYYMGNTLTKEIVPELNLNYPTVVRKLVLFAIQKGWNPQEAGMSIKNGMEVLRQLDYDITPIHIETETIHELLIEPINKNKNENENTNKNTNKNTTWFAAHFDFKNVNS